MVGVTGLEPVNNIKNQPQKYTKFLNGTRIGSSLKDFPSKIPSYDADPDLKELCNLWSKLSPEIKHLLLLMARDGGKAK